MAFEIVTAEDVTAVGRGGELRVKPGTVVTDWAREIAHSRGVKIIEADGAARLSIAIGADHGGFALKEQLKALLLENFAVRDVGAHGTDAVDYPDFAAAVGRLVATSQCDFGVMIDAAGIGSAMAANKIRGVRAAMCHDEAAARNAREHNDANVMTLGAKVVDAAKALALVRLFVSSKCVEDRHKRRVAKIVALERN
ncbi:MAG: RpiB/LacA/LacB family sugar-phosphate isomerase [Vicinamibacteria bacterium]